MSGLAAAARAPAPPSVRALRFNCLSMERVELEIVASVLPSTILSAVDPAIEPDSASPSLVSLEVDDDSETAPLTMPEALRAATTTDVASRTSALWIPARVSAATKLIDPLREMAISGRIVSSAFCAFLLNFSNVRFSFGSFSASPFKCPFTISALVILFHANPSEFVDPSLESINSIRSSSSPCCFALVPSFSLACSSPALFCVAPVRDTATLAPSFTASMVILPPDWRKPVLSSMTFGAPIRARVSLAIILIAPESATATFSPPLRAKAMFTATVVSLALSTTWESVSPTEASPVTICASLSINACVLLNTPISEIAPLTPIFVTKSPKRPLSFSFCPPTDDAMATLTTDVVASTLRVSP